MYFGFIGLSLHNFDPPSLPGADVTGDSNCHSVVLHGNSFFLLANDPRGSNCHGGVPHVASFVFAVDAKIIVLMHPYIVPMGIMYSEH